MSSSTKWQIVRENPSSIPGWNKRLYLPHSLTPDYQGPFSLGTGWLPQNNWIQLILKVIIIQKTWFITISPHLIVIISKPTKQVENLTKPSNYQIQISSTTISTWTCNNWMQKPINLTQQVSISNINMTGLDTDKAMNQQNKCKTMKHGHKHCARN